MKALVIWQGVHAALLLVWFVGSAKVYHDIKPRLVGKHHGDNTSTALNDEIPASCEKWSHREKCSFALYTTELRCVCGALQNGTITPNNMRDFRGDELKGGCVEMEHWWQSVALTNMLGGDRHLAFLGLGSGLVCTLLLGIAWNQFSDKTFDLFQDAVHFLPAGLSFRALIRALFSYACSNYFLGWYWVSALVFHTSSDLGNFLEQLCAGNIGARANASLWFLTKFNKHFVQFVMMHVYAMQLICTFLIVVGEVSVSLRRQDIERYNSAPPSHVPRCSYWPGRKTSVCLQPFVFLPMFLMLPITTLWQCAVLFGAGGVQAMVLALLHFALHFILVVLTYAQSSRKIAEDVEQSSSLPLDSYALSGRQPSGLELTPAQA